VSSKEQIRSIQVLRGIAACAVVFIHSNGRAQIALGVQSVTLSTLAQLGHSGVDLFFVLSGFLMTHLHREQFGRGASLRFFRRRLIRIAPLYWVLTALAMGLILAAPHFFSSIRVASLPWVLGNFLFFPWTQPSGSTEHALIVGWTLDYEMYFYLLFALAMMFSRGLALITAVLVASYAVGQAIHPHHPWLQLLTSGLLLEFLAGIGIALVLASVPASARTRLPGTALVMIGVVLLAASMTVHVQRQWKWGIPLALILLGVLWIGARCEGRIGRALSSIGDASYSIYLFQVFALPVLGILLHAAGGRALPAPLSILALWIFGCAAGVLCWRVLEQPMGQLVRARFSNDRARPRTLAKTPTT
jgi:exopolysaccharide production protein ExoZ